jgi:hypothetical protein
MFLFLAQSATAECQAIVTFRFDRVVFVFVSSFSSTRRKSMKFEKESREERDRVIRVGGEAD